MRSMKKRPTQKTIKGQTRRMIFGDGRRTLKKK